MTVVTEEQARKKMCPLFNQVSCYASACMAWREASPEMEYQDVGNEDPRLPPKPPEGDGWKRQSVHDHAAGCARLRWAREKAKRGYCGAFGKPEGA